MGFYRLDKQLGGRIAEGMEWQPRVQDNGFDGRTPPTMPDMAADSHTAGTFIGQPSPDGAATDGNGGSPVESGSDIIQVGIGVLVELCVQPHQAKVSSGGGGGGNESGWGENDKEKNKYKPQKMRR